MKNNTTRCLIVDDEPLAIEIIETYLKDLDGFTIVSTCKNALQAFSMLEKESIDLLFLDIQMPQLTGIEFLKSLKNPPKVIFTTAYSEYALEGYELDIVDYLVKPIPFERFFKAISKYKSRQSALSSSNVSEEKQATSQQVLFVSANKKKHKVVLDDILYIESVKDYIQIHTTTQKIMVKTTLANFESKLPQQQFLRIHRSFIVNTEKITAFTAKDIEIGTLELPIGISYKQKVLDTLHE